ncbi:MAG: hypothetical protein QOJ41_224 [Acidobacteriaceae bacterium]|nr:hypothetical protein [Acidobacteriaceae bacterium]
MLNAEDRARFEQLVLPHLDAAFQSGSVDFIEPHRREDVTQDAMLRAFRFFEGFHGGDVRAWLLRIVRNTCYTWLEKNRRMKMTDQFDEEVHMQSSATPESIAIAGDDHERLTQALQTIPPRFREVIVLRELEGCSYKEIAAITSIPIGTVMSSLSRARRQLHSALAKSAEGADSHEL